MYIPGSKRVVLHLCFQLQTAQGYIWTDDFMLFGLSPTNGTHPNHGIQGGR